MIVVFIRASWTGNTMKMELVRSGAQIFVQMPIEGLTLFGAIQQTES